MMIIDDFLDSYDALKQYSIECDFSGVVNPVDGVLYPDINASIPDVVIQEVEGKLNSIFGSVAINYSFLRMSKSGVSVPHIAHTDITMGKKSLMLYLNNFDGGTAMIKHNKTGIAYNPECGVFTDIVVADQNNIDAWSITDVAQMKENRAAIFDAARFHCALPIGGFGDTQSNARIVMTVFFDD